VKKQKKVRSPNYPRVTIIKALDYLSRMHNRDRTEFVDEETIARDLGYKSVSGASIPLLSALKKYLLLDEKERRFRLSDRARKLLELPENSRERAEILEEIAFAPEIFNNIFNRFNYKLPQYEEFENYLEIKGFVLNTIPKVFDIYKQNLKEVLLRNEGFGANQPVELEAVDEDDRFRASKLDRNAQELKFDIAAGIELIISIRGLPPADSFEKLTEFYRRNNDLLTVSDSKTARQENRRES